ncbi:MAG TPA: serine hydrolase domain-containing protein, partial [Thermoanaerobaculia bacterium]|nr:serine hydrolase domain-containing protein [Thermoanaerobaculia bacterium]
MGGVLREVTTTKRLSLGILAAIFASAVRAAPDTAADRARRVDAIFASLNRAPSPGLAIVVERDGEVLLRRGYGLANLEHGVAITPTTVFDAASLAKPFTGLAVAMLAAEGKVALEDDVRKYLPELADFGRPITIDELLHHTSGLRDWPGALSIAGRRFEDSITLPQILDFAFHQRSLNFTPGAEHLYSNTGYNLLAEIVRRVSGESFPSWTEKRILRPLGMRSTRILEDATEVISRRAYGYGKAADGRWRSTPDGLAAPGSSSLFTTVDDLALWLDNFRTGRVGGSATVDRLRTPGRLNDGSPVRYALGILTGAYRGQPMFTHSGGWASFNSYFVYFPKKNFGVAVLANGDTSELDAQSAVIKVTDIYLEDEL